MAKYNLVHIESKGTFFNLTRLEMVNKLKQVGDLQHWFCWYPGLANWKRVSQAYEVKEWLSTTWTEDQPMPAWQDLLSTKTGPVAPGEFEIVEFTEGAPITPPPLPNENKKEKTEFVISGFSGQVFDFDESLKDKHLNAKDFKITKNQPIPSPDESEFEKTVSADTITKYDNTMKVDTTSSDFDKTVASNTSARSSDFESTVKVDSTQFDKTVRVEISNTDFEKTISGVTQAAFDKTIKVDMSGSDFDNTKRSTTVLSGEKTITSITPASFDQTTKVNPAERETVYDQTAKIEDVNKLEETGKIETTPPNFILAKNTAGPDTAKTTATTAQASEDLAQAAGNEKPKKHNRRYPRIKGRLRTIITNKSKAFMTFTKDISLGGIHVENVIPHDILNTEIEVYLSDPSGKKSILFRCHPVGDMKNPCRFSFAKADEKNIQKLSQWLDDLAKITAA